MHLMHALRPYLVAVALVAMALPLAAQGLSEGQRRGRGGPVRFEPVTSFGVSGGVAEIVAASADGNTLVYTDSGASVLGVVDITDPANPVEVATVPVPGEPTSVSIVGNLAVATVWADKPSEGAPAPAFLPGKLVVVDISTPASPAILATHDVGYHPDSVAVTRDGSTVIAVIAVENEPVVVENGVVTDEDRPGSPNDQSPAGLIQVVTFNGRTPANAVVTDVILDARAMNRAGLLYPTDPQPEFVAINGMTAAVSLQENNGVAIVDFSSPRAPVVTSLFSLGVAATRPADLTEDDAISLSETYPDDVGTAARPLETDAGGNPVAGGLRFPDALAWNAAGTRIITADEGELNFTGGRGWSSWTRNGRLAFEETQLERIAVQFGQYPEGRSENKGIEMEGVTTGVFNEQEFAFVMSERGSFIAVYELGRRNPKLVQILPTGISPEGVVAIENRGLLVTADEDSGTLSIYRATRRPNFPSADQPQLFTWRPDRPFSALSGLAPSRFGRGLWSVPDNALPTSIYYVRTGLEQAPVYTATPVRLNGQQARYDGEGIAVDTSIARNRFFGGWWIASEGNPGNGVPNLLVQVDFFGRVRREIQLPASIDPAADASLPGSAQGAAGGETIRSNGFEGVTISEDGRYLLAVIQREFGGEFATGQKFTRIARYDLTQLRGGGAAALSNGVRTGGDWEFFFLPLDATNTSSNWIGLSEIITIGAGEYAVIERDKGIGNGSLLKKVYAFSLNGLSADADGTPDASDTVTKVEVLDLLGAFFPYEKVEGLAILRGDLWVGLDNDGGEIENRLINTGPFANPLGSGRGPGPRRGR